MQKVSIIYVLFLLLIYWSLGTDSGADVTGLGKLFADPNLLGKLATNPRTQKHLADPSFVQKVLVIVSQLVNSAYTCIYLYFEYRFR